MKALLGWVLVLASLAGSGAYGLYSYRDAIRERHYAQGLDALKREFLTDSSAMAALTDEQYQRDIGPHLRKYFVGLENLAKSYPEHFDLERERKAIDEKVMNEAVRLQREERIATTLALFERLRKGEYRALYTASDRGFRFDIYNVNSVVEAGEAKLKFAYVHWGPFHADNDPNHGPIDYQSVLGNIRLTAEEGKLAEVPQIRADGQPPALQINPERWVREFIPGVEIGTYELPQLPARAESLELSFVYGIHTVAGTEVTATLKFPPIAIAENWRMPDGQNWGAEERVANEEELKQAGVQVSSGEPRRLAKPKQRISFE